jgi:hypothetical protein
VATSYVIQAKLKIMKPIYWVITVLAAGAIGTGAIYYAKQPASDVGPVAVHHVVKTVATPPSAASSSPADTSDTSSPNSVLGWKTYTNSRYGFSFEYPAGWKPDFLDDVSEPIVNLGSGAGEIISFYPKGRSGYDIDSSTQTNDKQISVDGDTAIETIYINDSGSPYLISVVFQTPLRNYPNFGIQLTSKGIIDGSSVDLFGQILSTFKFTK